MKRFFVIAAVAALAAIQANVAVAQDIPGTIVPSVESIPTSPDDQARAYYDPATGNIYSNIAGSVLVIGLEGTTYLADNRNDSTPMGGWEQSDPTGLGQLDFGGLANGTFNLGQLLAPNPSIRTPADFIAAFPGAIFRSGAPGVPEVRSEFSVIGVPEPGSLSLLALAGLGAVARRRR